MLRLADHVWTDHASATRCVTQLAEATQTNVDSPNTLQWMAAAVDALRALEQAPRPYSGRAGERSRAGRSAWGVGNDWKPSGAPSVSARVFGLRSRARVTSLRSQLGIGLADDQSP